MSACGRQPPIAILRPTVSFLSRCRRQAGWRLAAGPGPFADVPRLSSSGRSRPTADARASTLKVCNAAETIVDIASLSWRNRLITVTRLSIRSVR